MIPASAFQDIIQELRDHPLPVNNYRNIAGEGRSQAFGPVNRRCLPPDYSRQCWLRPKLYKLLLDFADQYVDIPYTSITVNQNYKADKHRDKNNCGDSFLVAFGDFTGGQLKIYEGEFKGTHDIRYNPIVTDFSKVLHSVEPFEGERYSLVFYTLQSRVPLDLPPPSVELINNKWTFKRGDKVCNGLPHPLRKKNLIQE